MPLLPLSSGVLLLMDVSFTISNLVARSMLGLGGPVVAFTMLLVIFATMTVGKVSTEGWILGPKLAFLKPRMLVCCYVTGQVFQAGSIQWIDVDTGRWGRWVSR